MPCNCCEITDQAFGEERARKDIKSYRKSGPAAHTREILKAVRSLGLHGATLLDVGGGIGAIQHELLGDTVSRATHVDASAAYLKEARAESSRRGNAERVDFVHADFVDVASELPTSDVVTLDRVVCCYPDFRGLLRGAAGRATRALVMSYPRETWYLRVVLALENLVQKIRSDPFRVFVHPIAQMEELLQSEGLRLVSIHRLFVWEIALYRRDTV